ncbi:MAG: protein kinase [Candidatus Latescibacterota bacterium]
MSLEPGRQLGPYKIEGAVGAGGMGEVYRATDTRLDRSVAIKVLPSHLSDHPELKQRFEREAKTISSLQHPNICALFDVGHEDGIDFLVMEYLEGESLAERLRQGTVPAEEALRIGVQITEALTAAHRNGVVHRDLKPGNIMLTRAGVKLLDFGLAKTAEGAASSVQSSMTEMATEQAPSDPLTEKGTVLGTFQYMAPEQLEGKEADARTDIFALGAVLYEMVTGKKPFEGKSQASLIASIMSSQPPAISAVQPMTPPALDRVIRTCLAKDPEERWQTAHDVALQLKWIDEGGSQAGVPRPVTVKRRSRERIAWMVAAAASVFAAVLAGVAFYRTPEKPSSSIRFNIEAPTGAVSFGSPRISPDGTMIAFDGTDSTSTTQIWVRPLNSLEAHPLPGTENCNRPFWSPDSRNVGFFSGGKLKRVPVGGGPPMTICEFSNGADGAWGSQDMVLFDGSSGDSIGVVPAGGGVPGGATRIDRERGEIGHGWPFFLPDGKRFLYIAFIGQGGEDEIRLGEIGSFETKFLTHGNSRIEYVPPGYLVYEKGGTLLAHPFDAGSGELTGDPFPLAEGIGTGDVGLAHFSGSGNGTLIYNGGDTSERQLVWFDRAGHELETVGDLDRYRHPALSPDGRRLAVTVNDPRSDKSDIWIIDMVRGVRSRFTFDPEDDINPIWSPDGKKVAFSSNRDDGFNVYVKNASGTGAEVKLVSTPQSDGPTDWSRDGQTIVLQSLGSGSWDVRTASASAEGDSTETRNVVVTPFVDAHGRLSPDGSFLAYTSNESGRFEIYVITYPEGDGKWQVSVNGGTEPMWRGDGKELFFMGLDRSLMAVDIQHRKPIEIGVPKRLFIAPVPRSINTRNRYVVSGDGQRFLMLSLIDRGRVPPTTVILNWTAELSQR